ncbi:cytochrome c biogenesis protein ResB [Prochlorococcus sp. MIT 1341]|uniref:cytochrome c biogenesis protein ResB n=1 Tax=Prochlorococcus sp. MIT 1341 TaxID=3096221 RepID=UPI002A759FBA|nr:cytochrome c biogenesis protein ResB [Prochlorococcus sp. MIT 1341]
MKTINRLLFWISNLKIAIALLFIIAIASALGTTIPQNQAKDVYLNTYNQQPWLGLIKGELLLSLQLDHVYTSAWFLTLLIWLGLSLITCSWRRQIPTLRANLKWVDYLQPQQLGKLALAETFSIPKQTEKLNYLTKHLKKQGWQVKNNQDRLAARKGVIGRVGPPLIHLGIVLLMIGAVWGSLQGEKIERFLAPGRSFDLLNRNGINQLTINLDKFQIDRDQTGRPEQFRSKLELIEPGASKSSFWEISVNHPLRIHGMTIYQADWSLAALTVRIGNSPKLQLPLKSFPELGEQIWGLVLPTSPSGENPLLLTISNEKGPIEVFDEEGNFINNLRPGSEKIEINGLSLQVLDVLAASGILLKRDPGVPMVYTGFAVILLGGSLSMIATKQLWVIKDPNESVIHVGGLSNRNLIGLANELPILLSQAIKN